MYVKTKDNKLVIYPYSVGLFRRDNPLTSFPKTITDDTLSSYGVYPVVRAPRPDVDMRTTLVKPIEPVLIDGVWIQDWTLEDKTPDAIVRSGAHLAQMATQAITKKLDAVAVEAGYDSLISVLSYNNSTNEVFRQDAEAFSIWRDKCWTYFIEEQSKLTTGELTVNDITANLPVK